MTEPGTNQYDQPVGDALSPREWDELVDLVVERIEDTGPRRARPSRPTFLPGGVLT